MTFILIILEVLSTVSVVLFLGSYLIGGAAARGTKLRYVCRSVQRPTQWVALIYMIVYLISNLVQHRWGWVALDAWNVTWISFSIRAFYNSDEDDFWKRLGKKLRKLARATMRRARALKPARPVPVAAGGVA